MSTINVELGPRSYVIEIGDGLISSVGERVAALGLGQKAIVVTNPRISALYGDLVTEGLRRAGFETALFTIPDGEEYKTLEEAAKLYDRLIELKMERRDPIVALGGGVIGDMAGFVAATYLRGVPYIQVPTTLLAQVDSSVGGKTAVNHQRGKNLIGAFYQPRAVIIDPGVLATLDEREMRAGLAEVVKYGVIRDADFFNFLEAHASELKAPCEALESAIERSCRVKVDVVAADETEEGVRAILNFGHTFGHALEATSGYGTYRHGEAVALGMAAASAFSVRLGLCKSDVDERIRALLTTLGLPTVMPAVSAASLVDSMMHDKKVVGAGLRFVLAKDIGTVVVKEVERAEVEGFLADRPGGT